MKRILALLFLVVACEPAREAGKMPHTITPDPTHNPQTYTDAPSDGDDANAVSVDAFFQDIADKGAWLEAGGAANAAAIAALTGVPQHGRVWDNGAHVPYQRESATGVGPDGFWALTSADGGRFIHPVYNAVTGQHLPSIGPVPSETTTNPTTAGRINRQFVPFGTYVQFPNMFSISGSSSSYSTLSGSTVTLNSPVDTNGFAAGYRLVPEFGTVEFIVSAWVKGDSAAAFNAQVWMEYSLDAGATWVPITSAAGTLSIPLTADNLPKALPLSFFLNYGAYGGAVTGRFMARLRAISDGTHTVSVRIDSDMFRVTYPT